MQYKVTTTIVSGNGEPVDMKFYSGDNLAIAIGAAANAAACHEDSAVPPPVAVHTLSVQIDFEADCPWRDVPRPQRPFWAKAACAGYEVETEVGILCSVHHAAMRGIEAETPILGEFKRLPEGFHDSKQERDANTVLAPSTALGHASDMAEDGDYTLCKATMGCVVCDQLRANMRHDRMV